MTIEEQSFQQEYLSAAKEYLRLKNEESLTTANNLGRRALLTGMSLTEVAAVHTKALVHCLPQSISPRDKTQILHLLQVGTVLLETLAPFEMSLRGFRDLMKSVQSPTPNPKAQTS